VSSNPQHLFGSVAILADVLPSLEPTGILVVASSVRHTTAVTRALAAWDTHVFTGAKVHVPIEVVEAAEATLAESGANVVVAIGGGSPIGLGKALKLRAADAGRALRFVAIPTTYAGSENTSIYGITRGRDKQTGRDDRVRPDIIVSDVELTLDLPIAMTAQSLCNAIAHVASALSTTPYARGELHAHHGADPAVVELHARHGADLEAVATVVSAIEALVVDPRDRGARTDALIAASACARCLDAGKPGVQHAFAHLLGGAFGVDHAPLHSILLPRFLAANDRVRDALERDATGRARWSESIDTHLLALLERAGAPTTLGALGITREALDEILATRPELPGDIARAAL
jgi:maleylacetate reductase